jgi:transcriptional regulator with XRE-family HTH domain
MSYKPALKPLLQSVIKARQARFLSQSELGQKLGLPQSYISNLERGKHDIRLGTFLAIARYLGFELMLVPLTLTPIVSSLIAQESSKKSKEAQSMYALDDDDEEKEED